MKFILTAALCLLVSGNALAQDFFKFDEYTDLSFSDEKARLDNIADYLRREPGLVVWYFIFAGAKSCAGEARLRAIMAKNYLVKKDGIEADRIIWEDEGYRDNLLVEIWLLPRWTGKPTLSNASTYTKDMLVLRDCKSNHHRQRWRMKL